MNVLKLRSSSAIKSVFNYGPNLNTTISLSVLDACLGRCRNLKQFNQILSQVILSGIIRDTYAASRVFKFYTRSSLFDPDYSLKIFNCIENSNGFIWNTMMKAFVQENRPQDAIYFYKLMLVERKSPDNYTYPILVQATTFRLLEFEGREMHSHVVKMGFHCNVYVQNTLINMYAVCGNMIDARKMFEESPVLDLVSWNSVLAGYVQAGDVEEAKKIYGWMPEKSIIASNSMIALLGRSNRVDEARLLFNEMQEKDLVSWTALLSCYEQNGIYKEALNLFTEMKVNGLKIDEVVVVSLLAACAQLSVIETGKVMHGLAVRTGLESYVNLQNSLIHMYSTCGDVIAAEQVFIVSHHLDQISWNSMITGYCKCGLIEKAKELFNSMPQKDAVSWSAMISGSNEFNQFAETLVLFQRMMMDDTRPDEITLVSVLSACAHLSALDQGKWIHTYIRKKGFKVNPILGTTLIDMYTKCGCIENAVEVFNGMEQKWVSSWNALILGLAINGQVEKSLEMFLEMKNCGVAPNEITLMAVLGACRLMGLVNEGRQHFDSMTLLYNIKPDLKHYGCMVDLLGRAGMLREAEELINSMPMAPDVATWGALLGACKKHGDKEMGERIGRKLIELQPDHDGFHVLLSNIYASKGNWDGVLEVRGMMAQQGVVKTPGCSMIEANGIVHEFLAGDRTHPQINEIDEMLDEMAKRLKMLGFAPDTDEVLLDINEEEKENSLFRHSEKLAIAFGLIAISPPSPIRIMKNLRICNDCHAAAKLISRAFDREIIIRDRHLFHHFKNGLCSCKEYW